jgi:hypothetical protein
MVCAPQETKENPELAVRELEPCPAKTKRKRLAVCIRKGKLYYVPVISTESKTEGPERLPSKSAEPPQFTDSS